VDRLLTQAGSVMAIFGAVDVHGEGVITAPDAGNKNRRLRCEAGGCWGAPAAYPNLPG